MLDLTAAREVGEPATGAGVRIRTAPAFFTSVRDISLPDGRTRTRDDIDRTELRPSHLSGFAKQNAAIVSLVHGEIPKDVHAVCKSEVGLSGVSPPPLLGADGIAIS